MSPSEIEQAVRRCDRRRRRPWIVFWTVIALVMILPILNEHFGLFRRPGDERRLKNEARITVGVVYNAIDQFHTEYDFLPMPTSGVKGRDWDTDSSEEEGVILNLKGMDLSGSGKAIDFLGDLKDARLQDGKHFDGLVRGRKTVALVDPWGHPYLIRLDGDFDGYVSDPAHPNQRLAKKAIVWAAGKDGDPETWKDNVGSWVTEP